MINLIYTQPNARWRDLPEVRGELEGRIRVAAMQDLESIPPPIQMELHLLGMIVAMTHETKDKVKKGLTADDYKKVGADNPDIWVNSKKDDRIVLTRPRTMGKGKKHVTKVRASELLGPDWRSKINAISFLTNTKVRQVALDLQHGLVDPQILNHDAITFIRLRESEWLAVPIDF